MLGQKKGGGLALELRVVMRRQKTHHIVKGENHHRDKLKRIEVLAVGFVPVGTNSQMSAR
jgi:hypothetical protein